MKCIGNKRTNSSFDAHAHEVGRQLTSPEDRIVRAWLRTMNAYFQQGHSPHGAAIRKLYYLSIGSLASFRMQFNIRMKCGKSTHDAVRGADYPWDVSQRVGCVSCAAHSGTVARQLQRRSRKQSLRLSAASHVIPCGCERSLP